MSVKFAIEECLYEYNMKRKITDAIAEDELAYMKRIGVDSDDLKDKKIVKEYSHQYDIEQIKESKFVYHSEDAEKGLEKYRTFCQAKINNFDLASLGSMIETLRISDDNQIKQVAKRKVTLYKDN